MTTVCLLNICPHTQLQKCFSSNEDLRSFIECYCVQMVNTEIRLNIFFAAKDGDALYSQQKLDQELTVAHIVNSLLQNSDLY